MTAVNQPGAGASAHANTGYPAAAGSLCINTAGTTWPWQQLTRTQHDWPRQPGPDAVTMETTSKLTPQAQVVVNMCADLSKRGHFKRGITHGAY